MKQLILILTILIGGAVQSTTAEMPRELATRAVEAALFKNGYGYVVREAVVPGPGEWIVDGPASLVHGSLWLEAEGARIERAVLVGDRIRRPATSLAELVAANLGRELEVQLSGEDWTRATITQVLSTQPQPRKAHRSNVDYYTIDGLYSSPPVNESLPRLVVLRTTTGQTVVPVGSIVGLRSTGEDLVLEVSENEAPRRLSISVTGRPGRLRMSYLTSTMTWAPSYQLELTSPEEARLVAKANVLNDAETWDDVSLKLVTGFPNLMFKQASDPLASVDVATPGPAPRVGTVGEFLKELSKATGSLSGQPSVALQSQYVGPLELSAATDLGMPDTGQSIADLFFYPIEHMSTRPGQRSYHPLFEATIPCRSVYLWEVPDLRDPGRNYRRAEDGKADGGVWHMLRLTNTSRTPWTTAPVMILSQGQPLGQDVLPYTAAGADTYVKLTRSMSLRTELRENEVAREPGIKVPGWSYEWVRITADGVLRIVNHRRTALSLVVKKSLSGEVESHDPPAAIETVTSMEAINPKQWLTWEVSIGPGESRTLSYRYQVLTR